MTSEALPLRPAPPLPERRAPEAPRTLPQEPGPPLPEGPRGPEPPGPARRLPWRRLGDLPARLRARAAPDGLASFVSTMLLVAFVLQLLWLLPRHEPWFDEGQAWLLARDAGVLELFTERLRYEGSPGLWHLLLVVPAKLGMPYATLQWIGILAATAGAVVLVRRAPFPLLVKAGLLSSYVIGYQYASVARSYTLVPLLLFGVATMYPRRVERVGCVALLLGLLATVSLHGFLVAGGIAAVHAVHVARRWGALSPRTRRNHLIAGAALLVVAAAVVAVVAPPADLSSGTTTQPFPRSLLLALRAYNWSLTGHGLVTGIVTVVCAWWFLRTRTFWLWALPTVALIGLSGVKYHSPWHDGMPFLVLVLALWVSLESPGVGADAPPRSSRRRSQAPRTSSTPVVLDGWARLAALGALVAVLVVQVNWFVRSYHYDYTRPYSGSEELVGYLRTLDDDVTVYAMGFHTLGVLPYLDHNPYDNFNDGELPGYWLWSTRDVRLDEGPGMLADRPDVVVRGIKFTDPIEVPQLPGYTATRYIGGGLWWKDRMFEYDAFFLYERDGAGPVG